MKYMGKVKGGVVILEGATVLDEGTVVLVEPMSAGAPTLGQRLKRFSGAAKQLPDDMAQNHDHYLHGRPKK